MVSPAGSITTRPASRSAPIKAHCDSAMARRRRSSELILWACQKEVLARPEFCFAGVPARSLQLEVRYPDRHHEQFSVRGVVGLARKMRCRRAAALVRRCCPPSYRYTMGGPPELHRSRAAEPLRSLTRK